MALIKMNFLSKMLGMQTNVTVLLPTFSFADIMDGRRNFYEKGMQYQVLWLLHGASGDDSDYVNFTNIVRYADSHKLAVVMPADFNQGYTDDPQGAKYFSYVVDELPQVLGALFPLSGEREDNFIAGLSMGAHGAMKAAILRPEQYAAALIMSGAARNPNFAGIFDPGSADVAHCGSFGAAKAPTNCKTHQPETNFQAHSKPKPGGEEIRGAEEDVYHRAVQNIAEDRPRPEFFFTCGEKDFALERAQYAARFLEENGYTVHKDWVPGYAHEWDFWDLSLKKAIACWLPIRHEVVYPGK